MLKLFLVCDKESNILSKKEKKINLKTEEKSEKNAKFVRQFIKKTIRSCFQKKKDV